MRSVVIFISLALSLLCGLCGEASAQVDSTLIIPPFQGSKPQGLRELAVQLLEAEGFEVVAEDATPDLGPKDSDGAFADAAAEHGALATVLAYTTLGKKTWRTQFTIRDGKTGKIIGRADVSSTWYPGLQKAYKSNLTSRLMKLLEQCEPALSAAKEPEPEAVPEPPPPKAEPKPTKKKAAKAKAKAKAKPANDKKRSGDGTAALVFGLGPAGALRDWTINDPLTNANDGPLLASHSAPTMGVRASLQLFPAAFFTTDAIRHIGLDVEFARSFIGKTDVENVTEDPNDATRKTTYQSYFGGLHIRIPLAPLELGVIAGFGQDSLTIDGSKDKVAVPDVKAQFIRGALGTRFSFLNSTSALLTLGYRYVVAFGDAANQVQSPLWFPDASGMGLEGRLELQHMFTSGIGVSLGGGMTHYALDFGVGPSRVEDAQQADQPAPPIAGGATDVYTTFDLNAVFVLGGE